MLFWLVLICIVFYFIYSSIASKSNDEKIIEEQKKPIGSGKNIKYSNEEFETILRNYKNKLNNPNNDDKKIAELAEEFEKEFDLRRRIFDFTSFLCINYKNRIESITLKKWWSSELLDIKKIKVTEISYRQHEISIDFNNFKLEFKQTSSTNSWYEPTSEYDSSHYDFNRKIIITQDKVVYEIRGSNYDIDGYLPPILPGNYFVQTFKPSSWLMELNNFLIDFEKEKPKLIQNIENLESENKINEAKKKYTD